MTNRGGLDTDTMTAVAVVTFPAASTALAARVWMPFVAVLVSQVTSYGSWIGVAQNTPSRRNWTDTTPTLSDACADRVAVPASVAPWTGAVSETTGESVSAEFEARMESRCPTGFRTS